MSIRNVMSVLTNAERDAQVPIADPNSPGLCFRRDNNQLEVYDPDGADWLKIPTAETSVQSLRTRKTVAEVNAGVTLLAAVTGFKYRLVNARAIAIGGAVTTVTTVDILGTQSTVSRKLVAFAQASMTQSTVLTAGGSGATVLADGASFLTNDSATAITANITGASITVATHVDFLLEYVLEAA